MKKFAKWLAALAILVFVIDWGVVGVKLMNGDYNITAGLYVGWIAIGIFFACILYIRVAQRCKYCGKRISFYGKYCPYCGKEQE